MLYIQQSGFLPTSYSISSFEIWRRYPSSFIPKISIAVKKLVGMTLLTHIFILPLYSTRLPNTAKIFSKLLTFHTWTHTTLHACKIRSRNFDYTHTNIHTRHILSTPPLPPSPYYHTYATAPDLLFFCLYPHTILHTLPLPISYFSQYYHTTLHILPVQDLFQHSYLHIVTTILIPQYSTLPFSQ